MGYIVFGITSIWAFILSSQVLNLIGGFWLLFAGVIFFPITYLLAPWYAVYKWGQFGLVIIGYVGPMIAGLLVKIGENFHKK